VTTTTGPLTFEHITATTDRLGRDVLVIPDDAAAALRLAVLDGWTEVGDVNAGTSRPLRKGTWANQATAALSLALVAGGQPAAQHWAAKWREVRAFVVGTSGWNAADRWWCGYPDTDTLRVPGWARYTGLTGAYTWAG
jgi:hypothetical protein